MIILIRADEIAGAIVDGKALDKSGICKKFDVESESGLGSSAFKRRNKERSVIEPVRPPRTFCGEVWLRHGTSTRNMGNAAPRAMKEERAASLRPVNIVRWARAAEVSGVEEESEGMCAKGIKKARKLQGREGRTLGSALPLVLRLTLGGRTMSGVRRKPASYHARKPMSPTT